LALLDDILRDIRTGRFWRTFATNTFAGVGVGATALGLYELFVPGYISRHGAAVVVVVVLGALAYGTAKAWPRPIDQAYSKPSTRIRLVIGDLFEQDANLVIGMSNTFDTAVPHAISRESIQGQFLERVFAHDQAAIDAELAAALSDKNALGTLQKPGKTVAYPVGTVAVIRHQRKHYFCVAYSEMNIHNEAQGTIEGVWTSLTNLWNEARQRVNGEPIAIPVIGGGLSRISQIIPAQDSIRFIALSFMFASRHRPVSQRLDIVIRKEDVRSLDMLELKAFLKSLKES
jgi:hypothetical protein